MQNPCRRATPAAARPQFETVSNIDIKNAVSSIS
eukprot:SAG31_NODE_27224_length_429_cov_1.090909_1_plen_33_part_01